jgi:porphyrinogen peroxidase
VGTSQPGIFVEKNRIFHALEFKANKDSSLAKIKSAIQTATGAAKTLSVEHVIAFGSAMWGDLNANSNPVKVPIFETVGDPNGNHAIATQHDVLIWLSGTSHDDVLDAALAINTALADVLNLQLDQPGFTYRDSRDLTGFIDGTANPKDDVRQEVALIPQDLPGAGGTFMLSQKWVHNLANFNALSEGDQERVIGRTKPDSIELTGDAMPETSHVSRTDVKQDGVAFKIYRRSFPFGGASEHGLYFLAFSFDPMRFDVMLRRMFGVSVDNLRDKLTEYSKAVKGSYWFAPSLEDLEKALK